MSDWKVYLREHQSRYVNELLEFLRIPSISSSPDHAGDVERAGQWVADRLRAAGLENVRVLATGGHPVVYGDWLHADDKPTIMIYGHFDTQPVDPVDLWNHPPFEPFVEENRIYARGASDDKGNMLVPVLAVEALLAGQGALPVNIKFFFEGQEEIGSPQLADCIASHKDLLACDLILSADGGQWAKDQPALQIGLRGLCALQVDVRGAKGDVHSGTYGGTFMNPIHALARLIDSMRSSDGKIMVEGFYDAVRVLTETEREQITAIPYTDNEFKDALGISDLYGEPGFSTFERAWVRPTLEVNGIWGGFQEEGIKTVLPSEAHAKISCRLVPDQDPAEIAGLVAAHIEKHTPPGVSIRVQEIPGRADPYLVPHDHPGNQAALSVLSRLYGKEPFYARMGGSIPVCGIFFKTLGAYSISFGFGLKDENVHAPNEFFRLSSFETGQKAYCMMLEELSRLKP